MPLPSLRHFGLNVDSGLEISAAIEGKDLAALVGARKATSTGRSSEDVAAIASGLLDTLDATASEGEPALGFSHPSSAIGYLEFSIPVKADEATISWLKKNVKALEVKEWV